MIKNPNIFEIIRVCLSIANKILFYLPRTLMIEEFYEIIDKILFDRDKKYQDIYIDIHILNSANKIKAILLIFGNDIKKVVYYIISLVNNRRCEKIHRDFISNT
jgi:hypothetical protein